MAGAVAGGAWPRTDPGLQPQRTELAWNRTAIAMLANGVLVAGKGVLAADAGPRPVVFTLVGVAVLAAFAVHRIGRRRCRALADESVPLHSSPRRSVSATTVAVVLTVVTLTAAAAVL